MNIRAMKSLLSALGREAVHSLDRPADARDVMQEFCRAMSVRSGRPIELLFRRFPADIPVSGMRLDCGDRSIIVVEKATVAEAQLVILGHELWHEEQGDCGHYTPGLAATARALVPDQTPEALQRVVDQILTDPDVPREAIRMGAARAESLAECEAAAETFGLLFGSEVRAWVKGRYAEGPVDESTLEGRLNVSLTNRGRRILL
ncbi:toxin [Streptomyces sp. NBC_00525]|uniref:toxin n=1 Tax=Streptomyces sp. NBC_00525 TaxID=2903660 RepID=UPI002E80B679|nr:toxin [Streptomyces sp. NBC_00525]WUC94831.1 toxin [Streptomyces sp. NBC_00525]